MINEPTFPDNEHMVWLGSEAPFRQDQYNSVRWVIKYSPSSLIINVRSILATGRLQEVLL